MPDQKSKLLIFTDWFVPAFKAGGPIKSIKNLTEHLKNEYKIYIVTSNKDFGEDVPLPNITADVWQLIHEIEVIYVSEDNYNLKFFKRLLLSKHFDIIYVNRVFSRYFSIYPLIAYKNLRSNLSSKLIVAPRGMFGRGALQIKAFKKRLFLFVINAMGYYNNVEWHATSAEEVEEIKLVVNNPGKIYDIQNFPSHIDKIPQKNFEDGESLKMVYLSRITPKKNLIWALSRLRKINEMPIVFDIFGPIEDDKYWDRCLSIINSLPANIQVSYNQVIAPDKVHEVLKGYHLFFFPTKHENYGHVIIEALQAGLYIVASDQIPWKNLKEYEIGINIALNNSYEFEKSIQEAKKLITPTMAGRIEKFLDDHISIELLIKNYHTMFMKN